MAGKKISQLSSSLSPSLSGMTVVEYGGTTYKSTLQTLRTVLVDSGSHSITGSITASYFVGDGSRLSNLPLSSQLTTASFNAYTASVNNFSSSFDSRIRAATNEQILDGFAITGSNLFKGAQNISGSLIVGTGSLHTDNPEILHVENSGSYNIAHFQGNHQYYTQINLKNLSSANNASADLVVTADNGTENIHYVDMGINSSTYNGGFVGYANDAYVINVGKDLYVGTVGGVNHPSNLNLFAQNHWEDPQIQISGSKQISFNTGSVSEGFQSEFSGSVKFDNDVKVDGYIETGKIQGTGSLTLQPDLEDGRTIEIYNTDPSDIHIKGNATYTFLGDDTTYVKLDSSDESITINTNNGVSVYGNTNLNDSLTVGNTIYGNVIQNNGQDLNIMAYYPNNIGLWSEGGTVNVTGSLNVNDDVSANYFYGDGSQLTNVATSFTGEWVLSPGTNNVSFTVPAGHTYTMWVNGNIPNGIVVWNATVTTSNTNVPVVGSQYAWYYSTGNHLVFTSIPDQIVGSNGSIISSPISYNSNDSNVFKFGITNNSGDEQTINWGYTKI
jgi:cytoskeletal protein CcmA (bactofilin family)